MKLAALISGGKDSIYAAFKASKHNKIACLISFKSKRDDSYMFHIPNIDLVKQQAKVMNLPLLFIESSGIKEKELKDITKALKTAIKKYKINGVVSGALASNYQKERIDKICNELKLKSIAPLWHINPEQYLKDLIKNNFKIIITGIAADGLNKDFLGKEINNDFINIVKKLNIHLGGEGGEYESLVLDCPLFDKKLKIKKAKIEMENYCTGKFIVEDVELVRK
ncbi:TIGR00289 family protein [Candidatus Woesearchaeota archaeon]|jgi:asparagine synthase (glutamine-hydrolysing)|nr:TIGR00289 family protein [Candidatus Woesearchaeota archaeon]|tara:strand:+ start:20 stop:691 length:672 start_codon:yes stop_codon:yes gene_type:complete